MESYGSNGKVSSTTDEAGYVVYYTYDAEGNRTGASYDSLGRVT
ncbi:MAG: hypothetical protein ACI4EX_11710, partial [Lachnospiraceae bacterium]